MPATDEAFRATIRKILSAQHYTIQASAGAWTALAGAAEAERGALSGTAAEAAGEPGAGLLELADRIEETSGWAAGAGAVAQQVAEQLLRAGERSAQAGEQALRLDDEYTEVEVWEAERVDAIDVGMGVVRTHEVAGEEKQRLADEARHVLDELGAAFAEVIGAQPPEAPGTDGGGTTASSSASSSSASSSFASASTASAATGAFATGPAAAADSAPSSGARADDGASGGGTAGAGSAGRVEAPNGSVIGAGDYPHSRVVGPEGGDFAGWVQSPGSGFLVDPATGREFDPVAGRWIDPVTGQPFGEVTEYAARLSGLGAGPGAIAGAAGIVSGTGPLGGTAALAALYGGVMPPSIGHAGPARNQLIGQANRHLGQRARVATRFALHEAAQGGRPFTPPPGAAGHGGGRAGRAAARPRPVGEPAATWRTRAGDAVARHQLAGGARPASAPPPGAAAGARSGGTGRDERGTRGRPTDLTEDPAVWAPGARAGSGVLGD
ncbi:hypothetical protein [Streptomyces litchfieldiae]|uniref:Uncharacterized protein n=1 Tax=Streptomyces litchfieldiae TaxID=3075543 RepID=A0ABU2MZT9_9ACTN|nr:hypothetical protein [Streptomyces sp. DSM 44938]MDT0346574.1 hypothetical protein [Streptomyces sp. DSM 44938]